MLFLQLERRTAFGTGGPVFRYTAGRIARSLTSFNRRTIRSLLRGAHGYIFGRRGQGRVHGWKALYRLRVNVLLHSPRAIREASAFQRPRLWVDDEAFPRIFKLLRRARHTVLIQMFIWKDDRIGRKTAEVLCEAADRGVNVEIFKEAVGDFFETDQDFLTTKSSEDPVWKRFWNHKRIRVVYEPRNDHTKVFIIDDNILLLTGMNVADEYHEEWHDYMVELKGHAFIEHYLSRGEAVTTSGAERLVMNTDTRKDIRPVMMELISAARETIVIEHCYFSDTQVVDALAQRSHEGVRVTVIVPKEPDLHYNANQQAMARLLSGGHPKRLQVFQYPRIVHGKIMLIDRSRAFIGSANLMASSLDEMGEVNVLLSGANSPAILKLRQVLRDDILQSEPLRSPPSLWWFRRWLAWLKL